MTTRDSLPRDVREALASDEIAEQLDSLSRPLAERVLGRAIELQSVQEAAEASDAAKIGYDDLREIALEIGIPEDALKRALLEELETERDHGATPMEKVTGPKTVRGGLIVEGDRGEIERKLRAYLEQVEGLQIAEDEPPRLGWRDTQNRPARDRIGFVQSITTDQKDNKRHLLEIDISTAEGRKRARRIAIVAVILGTVFGGAIGGFAILGGILLGIGAGVAGALSWLRRVTRKARNRVNQALGSVTTTDEQRRNVTEWLELWESLNKPQPRGSNE